MQRFGSALSTGGEPRKLTVDEAVGQLTLQPLSLSTTGDAQVAAAVDRVRKGEVGGVIIVPRGRRRWRPDRIADRVKRLEQAASDAHLPPPLIVLAVEGIKDKDYCAPIAPIPGSLRDALARRAPQAAQAAVSLRAQVRSAGANVLLGTSFKDGAGCGRAGRNGLTVAPRVLVDGLYAARAQDRVALIARGGQDPEQVDEAGTKTAKFVRYRQAGSHLWLVAASMAPDVDPTWRNPDAITALRGALERSSGHDVVIATPDVAAARDALAVDVALASGADLVISSSWRGGELADEIHGYFDKHPDRLRLSCARIVTFKTEFFGSKNAPQCP